MTYKTHEHHDHIHGADRGHTTIKHEGHADYLHDDHLHHEHNSHYDEYALSVNETNPDDCHPVDTCHDHVHGEGCDHEVIPHGSHIGYVVNSRLHYQHGDHYGDHGPIGIVK